MDLAPSLVSISESQEGIKRVELPSCVIYTMQPVQLPPPISRRVTFLVRRYAIYLAVLEAEPAGTWQTPLISKFAIQGRRFEMNLLWGLSI